MPSKLELIVEQRRADVASAKASGPDVASLEKIAQEVTAELGDPLNLFEAIRAHGDATVELFVAAEFKRASPSKGNIATDLDVGEQASKYGLAGAGLVSVLTEPKWFLGTLDDLLVARRAVNQVIDSKTGKRPLILRKDFVIDEYQLYEARAFGADTVLLMLSILSETETSALIKKSRELGMEPLVEVVNEEELAAALRAGAKVLGVNNRDLHTFTVDMEKTPRLVQNAREQGIIKNLAFLALSGIKTRHDVKKYESFGDIAGFLAGEALMRAPNPGELISKLIRDDASAGKTVRVKVCGMNDVESALVAAKAGADMIGVIFVSKSVRHATVPVAKDIVQAIRAYRETTAKTHIPIPEQLHENENWYTAHARAIGDTCDGQMRPLVVGVFMNQPIDEVNSIAQEVGIDMIQLHGSESKGDEARCCLPVIRVAHVDASKKAEDGLGVKVDDTLDGPASMMLLDTSIKGGPMGGTGKTFDWKIARDLGNSKDMPLLLAGGLTPENVAAAVEQGNPWGVDVASGVEASPGVKDHDKIRAFVRNVKLQS
mmetsp:Transcript_3712/g.6518  ORF Transcript_3712/g.6518 Transcript_3712/m.6518 type:complete len:545 (+) Transcript_3712:90-1724(+)|eukprot:CAMPEP_0184520508 /NCGR_PEP_ID=MMETSP0198_2-20121128/7202_1 /TAXON_ID=1112570 /ORGANISM="Thraustochytrium sp., Strain LLF1b" /LENGTH=544 /DNA_ID=CAMNT_0026911105 /DNA_START=65 /DNA_END=1699 /DNA_ORIENTATION=+